MIPLSLALKEQAIRPGRVMTKGKKIMSELQERNNDLTDEEKARDLFWRYRGHKSVCAENGSLLYDDLFGFPSLNRVHGICPELKVERRTGLQPQEVLEFQNICALGPELMFLCYCRLAFKDRYSYYTSDAMRAMCRGCKNYLPTKNEGRPYDPEDFKNDFSIFKPYFIKNTYGSKLFDYRVDSGEPAAYVYYITDSHFVKIGFAKDPYKRLSGIQTGNPNFCKIMWLIPFKTEKDAHEVEHDLHWIYSTYRCAGEWFDILDKLDQRRFKNEFYTV